MTAADPNSAPSTTAVTLLSSAGDWLAAAHKGPERKINVAYMLLSNKHTIIQSKMTGCLQRTVKLLYTI